jgi:hypothetical protein
MPSTFLSLGPGGGAVGGDQDRVERAGAARASGDLGEDELE